VTEVVSRRRGVTRTVFLIGRWAVKVPSARAHGDGLAGVLWSLSRGISANLSEREWTAFGGEAVCPVLFSVAGLVNVYPRCAPVPADRVVDYDSIGFVGPTDNKPHNVGLLRGRLVWIDYDMSWNDRPPCGHVTRGGVR
jgi:hypothetical protein